MLASREETYNAGLELNQAFAQVLRRLRLEKALTHEVLAERAGLHPTFISLLERGGRMPSLNTVFLIAKALDIKTSDFIGHLEKIKARPKT